MAAARVPDVFQLQVLVRYDDDPNFTWHHRVLLRKLTGSTYVVLTPTFSVQTLDLAGVRFVPLGRNAAIPPAQVGDVFLFDPHRARRPRGAASASGSHCGTHWRWGRS